MSDVDIDVFLPSKLDSRGHEVLDPKPFEPTVPIRRRPESVFDMVRRQALLAQLAADQEIKSEDDLLDDMTDFAEDRDGLLDSGYEVPDYVPDKIDKTSSASQRVPDVPQADASVPESKVDPVS